MTEVPLLEVMNLEVEFRQRRRNVKALDNLSFAIRKGEILGIVGESGAGKSLTGAAIMGLIEPPGRISGGTVSFQGQRIDITPEKVRGSDIGMIFQDPLTSLNPVKTVAEHLVETIQFHFSLSVTQAHLRAGELLEKVGILPERIHAYPHQFSGGMRQRIVIALALAAEPSLIIADEPTTALDVSIQHQILQLLSGICRADKAAMILITHDMGVVSELTDRVAVMYAGRLVELGPTSEVISNPRHPYTKGLMKATPSIDDVRRDLDLPQIPGQMPGLEHALKGCKFHPRCTEALDICAAHVPDFIGNVACHLTHAEYRKQTAEGRPE